MKTTIKTILATLTVATFLFTSCKKASPEEQVGRIIHNGATQNENAVAVYSFNGFSMLDKTNLSKVPGIREYAGFISIAAEKYRNPESFGADVSGKTHVVIVGDLETATGYAFTAIAVTDAKKFESSMKELVNDLEINIESDYSHCIIENQSLVIWSDQVAVILASSQHGFDLLKEGKELIAFKDQKVKGCPELADYLKKPSDVSGFAFIEKIMALSKFEDDVEIAEDLLAAAKEAYSEFHISFELGKLVFEQNNYTEKLNTSKYNLFNAGEVNENLINFLSNEESPLAILGSKINMINFVNLMDAFTQDGKKPSEELNKEFGWTGDKIAHVFTGDFGFSFNNIVMKTPEIDEFAKKHMDDPYFAEFYSRPTPTPIFSTIIGISDKNAILELLAKSNTPINEEGIADMGDIKLFLNDKMVLVSSDLTVIENAKTGQGKGKPLGNISSPIFGAFDGIAFSKRISPEIMAQMKEQGIGDILDAVERMDMNFSSEGGIFEIHLKEKDKNALEIFAGSVGKIVFAISGGGFL